MATTLIDRNGKVSAPAPEAPAERSLQGAILSPMVGTAYLSPEPGAAPFVSVGARVEEVGQ